MNKLLNENFLKRDYTQLIYRINALEDNIKLLSNSEIKAQTQILKNVVKKTNNFESIIARAFALVREASRRTTGLRHYDVQLLGGLTLNEGKIAEMRTGEGKTLVATLPAYLNSLSEKGVHIVTVNDYLAKRDYNSTRDIYQTLGISPGLIQQDFSIDQRQRNYNASITYVTNFELGFDYLRDNLAFNIESVVLPKLNFCLIDEIDLILIDEAQTPLIISQPVKTNPKKYAAATEIIKYLKLNQDFTINEKKRNIVLTSKGCSKVSKILNIDNLYDRQNPWISYILNALKAKFLFILNTHYIIQNNQIEIVDEFTGRISTGRKWSDGLHQAVQAKENLFIEYGTEITASITYQNFFLLYPKLAGMTGTAINSEVEFDQLFNLSIKRIPTAKSNQRLDLPDRIYDNQFKKWRAVINATRFIIAKKQPVLIGTKTIEQSEFLSVTLNRLKIYHQVLNAKSKTAFNESNIVALAGGIGSITIATNMAGRGTDISLGGIINFKISKSLAKILLFSSLQLYKQKKHRPYFLIYKNLLKNVSQRFISYLLLLIDKNRFYNQQLFNIFKHLNLNHYNDFLIKFLLKELEFPEKKIISLRNKFIQNQGGLYVIGTERNDSKRIDDQLRGRCGRQGESGTSQFFLSLDDKLWRLYIKKKSDNSLSTNNEPIESKLLSRFLTIAQNQLEEINYGIRKDLIDYDEPLTKQRNIVYFERKEFLKNLILNKYFITCGEQIISEYIDLFLKKKNCSLKFLVERLDHLLAQNLQLELSQKLYLPTISESLYKLIREGYNEIDSFEKFVFYLKKFYQTLTNHKQVQGNILKNFFYEELWLIYDRKKLPLVENDMVQVFNVLDRNYYLFCLDDLWQEHLYFASLHRESVVWRSYAQLNPLMEYTKDTYELYIGKFQAFRHLLVYLSVRAKIF